MREAFDQECKNSDMAIQRSMKDLLESKFFFHVNANSVELEGLIKNLEINNMQVIDLPLYYVLLLFLF